jgi:hypothetical protein
MTTDIVPTLDGDLLNDCDPQPCPDIRLHQVRIRGARRDLRRDTGRGEGFAHGGTGGELVA